MSVYDELLDELETLAKAMPDADEGETDEIEEPDGDEGGEGDGDGDEGKDEKPMAKSMTVTMEDGTEAEAIDAEALIKSMQNIVDSSTEAAGKVFAKQTDLLKSLSADIQSLKTEIAALKSEGRGRKSVVTMAGAVEEPMTKAMVTPSDILAKCLDAQKAGRLTALDVSMAEGYLNRGMAIPDRILGAIS